VDDEGPRLRRSRTAAAAAFLLLVLTLALAWWTATDTVGGLPTTSTYGVWPRAGTQGLSIPVPGATFVLPSSVAVALPIIATLLILFVRVAARSWVHEPRSWRRDLWIALALVAASLALALAWPPVGTLGTRTYAMPDGGGTLTEQVAPGAGWWTALAALALLAAASWMARPARDKA